MRKRGKRLSFEEEMELFCAQLPTDALEDVEFEDDETDEDFIQGWLRKEQAYAATLDEDEEEQYV